MNAIGFVRDQGIANAKLALELIPTNVVDIPDNELGKVYHFKKEELREIVEAFKLVGDYGYISLAKAEANINNDIDLKKAINLVEQCNV